MKTVQFWQDQLPNGQITNSSNRLVFLFGWLNVFLLIWYMVIFKAIDYALLSIVITAVTGQKLYQKYIEGQNLSTNTPTLKETPDNPDNNNANQNSQPT